MPNMKQGHGRSKADMAKPDVTTMTTHWTELAKTISVPHTEAEYRRLVAFLDRLSPDSRFEIAEETFR